MKQSGQADYVLRYLNELKAKTCVIEEQYVDRDYLIDYQKFYSRSFKEMKRFTKRIHFFSKGFSPQEFEQMLEHNKIEDLEKSYLGFVVVKPIEDQDHNFLLGRTLLKTYPKIENDKTRHYITNKYKVSLFGVPLEVESVPFQAQDRGVSACATIALWTALQALEPLFKLKEYAPAEITELSTEIVSEARIFPQEGLTLNQMIKCIRSLELDVEVISAADDKVIPAAIKAYTNAGIPLIADLKLLKGEKKECHAAVIVGYSTDSKGELVEIYVHDDQIGPYSRSKPVKDFRLWDNEWLPEYSKIELEKLIVPIYHKIRLPWHSIYYLHEQYNTAAKNRQETADLYLFTIQKFKAQIINEEIEEKSEKLKKFLPRFIWVERISSNNREKKLADFLFDGTAIYPDEIESIKYK
jgi:hypothetical protein